MDILCVILVVFNNTVLPSRIHMTSSEGFALPLGALSLLKCQNGG